MTISRLNLRQPGLIAATTQSNPSSCRRNTLPLCPEELPETAVNHTSRRTTETDGKNRSQPPRTSLISWWRLHKASIFSSFRKASTKETYSGLAELMKSSHQLWKPKSTPLVTMQCSLRILQLHKSVSSNRMLSALLARCNEILHRRLAGCLSDRSALSSKTLPIYSAGSPTRTFDRSNS